MYLGVSSRITALQRGCWPKPSPAAAASPADGQRASHRRREGMADAPRRTQHGPGQRACGEHPPAGEVLCSAGGGARVEATGPAPRRDGAGGDVMGACCTFRRSRITGSGAWRQASTRHRLRRSTGPAQELALQSRVLCQVRRPAGTRTPPEQVRGHAWAPTSAGSAAEGGTRPQRALAAGTAEPPRAAGNARRREVASGPRMRQRPAEGPGQVVAALPPVERDIQRTDRQR